MPHILPRGGRRLPGGGPYLLDWQAVRYDRPHAATYDDDHPQQFAEAAATATALAQLHAAATARIGGDPLAALELGIGTGRLALPLAQLGVEVDGIDSSEAMVARLRAKPGGRDLRVVVGNFAEVGQLLDRRYALVFVAYNTLFELTTQEEQLRCFAGVAARLAPGGMFAVECLAPDLTRLEQTLSVVGLADERVTLQATSHNPVTQLVRGHDITLADGAGVQLEPWTIRYASVPEIDLMARVAGLHREERWGGWAREPFTAASARHVSVYGKGPAV